MIGGHEEDPAFGRGHSVDGVQKAAEGQAVQALVGSFESWKVNSVSSVKSTQMRMRFRFNTIEYRYWLNQHSFGFTQLVKICKRQRFQERKKLKL